MPRASAASASGRPAATARSRAARAARRAAPASSATPAAREPDALHVQLARDAARAQVGGEVEARVGMVAGRRRVAGERELIADRRPARQRPVAGARTAAAEAQQDARAASRPVAMRASADAPNAEGRTRVSRCARAAIARPSPIGVEGRSSASRRRAPNALPPSSEGRGDDREQGRSGERQAGEQACRCREAERRIDLRQRESGRERADRDVPRPSRNAAHSCRASRSVASRFSPMPSTCASSASERNPPCSSR